MAQWKITQESGVKLIAFLRSKLDSGYSLRFFKRALESGCCKINKRIETFGTRTLGKGDVVEFNYEQIEHSPAKPKKIEPKILFADDKLVIINKPSGIASDDPILIKDIWPAQLKLVHRLDKETSGALIFARGQQTFNALVELFRKLKVKKKYLAIVDGIPLKKQGVIQNYLAKTHAYQGQSIWGESKKEDGLLAITEWRIIDKGVDSALVACTPVTGRTHQIRIHLSDMGHPILGDKLYGKTFQNEVKPSRCMLHALEISFPHPFQDMIVAATALLPEDFSTLLAKLNLKPNLDPNNINTL